MAKRWFEDGAGVVWVVQDGADPAPGWVEVTESDYDTWYEDHQTFIANNKASNDLTNCLVRKAVYHDLKSSVHTADWDEATIRFLSNYDPDTSECE